MKRETGALVAGGDRSAPTEPEARRTEDSISVEREKTSRFLLLQFL